MVENDVTQTRKRYFYGFIIGVPAQGMAMLKTVLCGRTSWPLVSGKVSLA